MKFTAVATIVASSFTFIPAQAASFSTMSDTMTRVKVSTTADHTIVMTLPTGVDFDATTNTDVLSYDFPETTAFTQGGTWATTDFTFNDGSARTISAVASGAGTTTVACTDGTANVGVAIDTTTLTFRVIPCGTSYTASATGATVTFTIQGTDTSTAGTLTNPASASTYDLALSMTDEGVSNANSGDIYLSIVDDDQVTVTATVTPSMTFDLDTANSDTETAAPYTVPLGTLTTGTTTVSNDAGSGINAIWFDLDSNASGGVVITVRNANGASGLVSTSTPADGIPNAAATMAAGTANYGLCVASVTATTGTLSKAGNYTSGTCVANTDGNAVKALTTTDADIASTAAPIVGGRGEILVNAAISTTTPAHDDYTDTLTFIATGTF